MRSVCVWKPHRYHRERPLPSRRAGRHQAATGTNSYLNSKSLLNKTPDSLFAQVVDEVNDLLSQHARRIDIQIKETGGTPRKMHTVSAGEISRDSQLISAIYSSA